MRFLHLADLHFGKLLHGLSLLEQGDQSHWTEAFLARAAVLRPDAVVIAGDVYDRGMPPADAVALLSRLVDGLAAIKIPVLICAGNHDSGKRLACFRESLSKQNVHIAGELARELPHVTLHDTYGPVDFWLMPYLFPAQAGLVLGDESIRDYDTAVRRVLAAQSIDFTRRNVLLAHQNVTCGGKEGLRGGSESVVGGVGQVDYTAFDGFDYVALGHIHAAYSVGRAEVRYAGTPMCYHFSELRQPRKGPVLVDLGAKGTPVQTQVLDIPPLHPMRELRGSFEEICRALENGSRGEYLRIVLTDRPMTTEAITHFQAAAEQQGSILLDWSSEFRHFDGQAAAPELADLEQQPIEGLFADFYTERSSGTEPEPEELEAMHLLAELLRNTPRDTTDRDLTLRAVEIFTKEAEA